VATTADAQLVADVGLNDSYAIGITDANGAPVKHLDPGRYTLLVHDHSSFHNFHLSGPNVEIRTDVAGTGDSTYTIDLTDGIYTFVCDAHNAQMRGTFTVGTATTPPPVKPPAPAAPQRLSLMLGPTGRVSFGGAGVLTAGRFVITVRDRSAADGFRLFGPGVARSTGLRFRGTVNWTVSLRAGRYTFGSIRHPKLRRTLVVSAA
jgi:hypothetical protein